MSMPNKDKRFAWADNELLFQCECKADELLQVYVWHDDPEGYQISFATMGAPTSLWGTLRAWWHRRNRYYQEIILSNTDIEELVKELQTYIQNVKTQKVPEEQQENTAGH